MKNRGRLVPELDRLESRTCPSTAGIASALSAAGASAQIVVDPQSVPDASDSMTDAEGGMYDWVMMAMIPEDMLMMVNEYDQSAKTSIFASSGEKSNADSSGMVGSAPQDTAASAMSSSETGMPPAQTEMMPEPLVRPGAGSSRRMPMPERIASDEADAEDDDSSTSEMPEESETNAPPRLSPGELAPSLEPNLEGVPLEPFLENAAPPPASVNDEASDR
jgi:hypothetical protein